MKLTKAEKELAGKLADAGPSDEYAREWLGRIIQRREARQRTRIVALLREKAEAAWDDQYAGHLLDAVDLIEGETE